MRTKKRMKQRTAKTRLRMELETEKLAAEPAGQHEAVTIEGESGGKKKQACCVCI